MATKEEVKASALAILAKHGIKEDSEVATELLELLAPKKAGKTIDVESMVRRDANGVITEIMCRLSGVWLPATTDFFFPNKAEVRFVTAEGEGLYPTSRQAEKLRKEFLKEIAASKAAITEDVLDEKISASEGKAMIEGLADEPDYSSVTAELPVAEEPVAEAPEAV